jgi:hypothetical protein
MSKYWKVENQKVFWNGNIVRGADAESLTPLSDSWAKDSKNVYCQKSTIKGADAATFEVLNPLWARDKERAYYTYGLLPDANASTFATLDNGIIPQEDPNRKTYGGYATDGFNVFFYMMTIGKPSKIPKADPSSFQIIKPLFARDKNGAYYERNRIQGADPSQLTVLGGIYSTDGKKVFYGNKAIVGAHAPTFAVSSSDVHRASDKLSTYINGMPDIDGEFTQNTNAIKMHREVRFSLNVEDTHCSENIFTGLEEELATFLALCNLRSIEEYEKFTRGKRGENAVIRSVEKLNAHIPKPVAIITDDSIEVTPYGLSAYKQLGQCVDHLIGAIDNLKQNQESSNAN